MMKQAVVLIDSGITASYRNSKNIRLCGTWNAINDNDEVEDAAGHGTAVLSIINTVCPVSDYFVIKIFDKDLSCNLEILKKVAYFIKENFEESIIHISAGATYYDAELHEVFQKIYENGNIIVSAFDNSGAISYPAALDFVIGVQADDRCQHKTDFILPYHNVVSVFAKGGFHRVAWLDGKYSIQQGNSMSAAYVTAFLAREKTQFKSKEDALKYIRSISTYPNENGQDKADKKILEYFSMPLSQTGFIDGIKKAGIFPYNKETSTLVNFHHLLTYEITHLYTSKYLGNVSKTVKSIYDDKEYLLEDINELHFTEIDTLILGHLDKLETLSHDNLKEKILELCLKNHVNVFSLDEDLVSKYEKEFIEKGVGLYYPKFNRNFLKTEGKLYQFSTPIVAVIGTGSQQGKFTLQLRLKELLKSNGYTVAHLSTEPTGPLAGSEECFPFGYNSKNTLSEYEFISTVNKITYQLELRQPDIILAGSQSGTIPKSFNHIGELNTRQFLFLLGLMPDAVILTINPTDDPEYLRRAIFSLENYFNLKVIALAVFPFYYPNGWNYVTSNRTKLTSEQSSNFKKKLEETLHIKGYMIGDKTDEEELVSSIIDYFAEGELGE